MKTSIGSMENKVEEISLKRYERQRDANTSKKTEEEGMPPNWFYEAYITLIPKPGKDNTKRKTASQYSLINTDAKILYKIPLNWLQ